MSKSKKEMTSEMLRQLYIDYKQKNKTDTPDKDNKDVCSFVAEVDDNIFVRTLNESNVPQRI